MSKNILKCELVSLMALKQQCAYQFFQDEGLSELSVKQMMYLALIANEAPLTISDIAIHFDIAKPSVTQMVRRFEDLGLTMKEPCKRDKRKYYVVLTEQGMQIANMDDLIIERLARKITDALENEEIIQLVSLLARINEVEE